MYNTTNIVDLCGRADVLTGSTYLIKVEMVDGSSQLVQITKEQAITLGIDIPETENAQADVLCLSKTKDFTKKNQALDADTQYNYKVIHPEDLNLKPNIGVARGRPKKRPPEGHPEIKSTPPKIIKPTRTRSGRITRPPIHMEKDFEKIVTDDEQCDVSNVQELLTAQFEPLKTNEAPMKESITILSPEKKKKRSIPSQFRCSTCQKAYLGRNRMALHLKKHPDHGLMKQLGTENSDTWSCLIETALKAKEGQKGSKFCREILNLITNARTLVKYFFKPVKVGKGTEYYVDTLLSSILNVKEGDYRFNENELCKDISIFSFLEFFDDNFTDHVIKFNASSPVEKSMKVTSLNDGLIDPPKNNNTADVISENKPTDVNLENVFTNNVKVNTDSCHKANIDLHFGSDIMDVIKENTDKPTDNENVKKINFIDPPESGSTKSNNFFNFDKKQLKDDDHYKPTFTNIFDFYKNSNQKCASQKTLQDTKSMGDVFDYADLISNLNKSPKKCKNDKSLLECNEKSNFHNLFDSLTGESPNKQKYETKNNLEFNLNVENNDNKHKIIFGKKEKEIDIFPNTLGNVLDLNITDHHLMSVLPGGKSEGTEVLNEKRNDNLITQSNKNQNPFQAKHDFETTHKKYNKKTSSEDFDLHKLHLLSADISDEFILSDAASNILDTSINSDDIMNVDQFVNERFKKLTEASDVEIPNLDLPSMDCFNFQGS